MKKIYLIRHGRQNTKLCNLDVPLAPEGREQSELLASRIEGMHFDRFFSSSLLRAKETATIINKSLNMDIVEDACLDEIDWGDITGLSNEEKSIKYCDFLKKRILRDEDIPFPNGESGEDVYRRAKSIFTQIENSNDSSILIVTHGGLIRSVICGLLGIPFKDKLGFGYSLENTSISELWFHEDGNYYTLERLNDYSHLEHHKNLLRSAWL